MSPLHSGTRILGDLSIIIFHNTSKESIGFTRHHVLFVRLRFTIVRK